LGLIVHGRYITVKEDAHTKLINVIKITEIYEEVKYFLTKLVFLFLYNKIENNNYYCI